MALLRTLFVMTVSLQAVFTFYLEGLAPATYCKDAQPGCESDVQVYVNRLNSFETVLPYEFHTFDFCETYPDPASPVENLGQVVFGDRIYESAYKFGFNRNETCKVVCQKTYKPGDVVAIKKLNFLKRGISYNYQHHWIIDNMPVTWCYMTENGQEYCSEGFSMGCYVTEHGRPKDYCVANSLFREPDTYYIFNHVDITIDYHPGEEGSFSGKHGHILAARIIPRSIKHPPVHGESACSQSQPVLGVRGGPLEHSLTFNYTYSVSWRENRQMKWSSRWDYILEPFLSTNIMWFSSVNSGLVLVFLTLFVGGVLWRTLRRKSKNLHTNQDDKQKLAQDDTLKEFQHNGSFRWKLIEGEVFRRPVSAMLLAAYVGTGCQIFLTAFITLVLASVGILSPPNRGALMTCTMVLYVCLGASSGYVSARLYKMVGGDRLKSCALLTAYSGPGVMFAAFLVLNTILWIEGSSAALPVGTIFALLALWLGVSAPLTFVGAYFGFRRQAVQDPSTVSEVPRPIPVRPLCKRLVPSIIMGGVLPFGCIFIQLFFILNSIWSHQMYNSFGHLLLAFVIAIVVCCDVTILLCYMHLCAEDYHWWWRSFLTSGFTAVYFFIYCIHLYFTKLELFGFASGFLYFGYTFMMFCIMFLLTGSAGFLACFWFVSKIYGSLASQSAVKDSVSKPVIVMASEGLSPEKQGITHEVQATSSL